MTESHASSAGAPIIADPEALEKAPRVAVLVPLPLAGAYDYLVGEGALSPGDFVMVPLGRRETLGVVWDGVPAGTVASAKLRPVTMRLEVPPMRAALRRFVEWVAAYTMAPPGAVLRMTMSVAAALEEVKPLIGYRVGAERDVAAGVRRSSAARRVMALAAEGRGIL